MWVAWAKARTNATSMEIGGSKMRFRELVTLGLGALVAMGTVAIGCGGDSRSGGYGSCAFAIGAVCIDYVGPFFAGQAKASCPGSGSFSTSPCPTANRSGTCRIGAGTQLEQALRCYQPMTTPQCAGACDGGAFEPN